MIDMTAARILIKDAFAATARPDARTVLFFEHALRHGQGGPAFSNGNAARRPAPQSVPRTAARCGLKQP